MPPRITLEKLLSHLARCKECDYYVGAPVLCKGSNDPTHKDYWFEKCLNNAQPFPDSCDHFAWRQDLGKGKSSKKTFCPGFLCREEGKKPQQSNTECTFGVCLQCCRHLQPRLPTARACAVGSHRAGVEYPQLEVTGSGKPDPPPTTRGQRAKAAQAPAKKASKARTSAPRSASVTEVSTPSRRPPKRDSHAMPVTPGYLKRVFTMDAEKVLDEDRRVERDRQDRVNAQKTSVFLRWWTKEGQEADAVEAPVENLSNFHPKDVPLLVDLYHCDTQVFQYYDSKKRVWITGSQHSANRDLRKLNDEDMCYRSHGVTSGVGMPGMTKKRPAPDDSVDDDTPRRPIPPFGGFLATPSSTPRRFDSPSGTEPPRSGSSTFTDEPPTAYDADFAPDPFDFEHSSPSFIPRPPPFASTNDWQPPLPALFPTDSDITTPSATMQTGPQPGQPLPALDLSTAPRGRTKTGWPWRYVCDMAAGFDAIRRLQDGQPPMTVEEAFADVFQAKFIITTYREQIRAWRAAGRVTGERDGWIRQGRTEGGEWLTFMKRWWQR